jgi:hypothetical protein
MRNLRDRIGGIEIEDDGLSDTIAIALATYFEHHANCPDTDDRDENGWHPWASEKAARALDLIVEAIKSPGVAP